MLGGKGGGGGGEGGDTARDDARKAKPDKLVGEVEALRGVDGADALFAAHTAHITVLLAERLAEKPHHQQPRELDERLDRKRKQLARVGG